MKEALLSLLFVGYLMFFIVIPLIVAFIGWAGRL
jgi:hypothetical protein